MNLHNPYIIWYLPIVNSLCKGSYAASEAYNNSEHSSVMIVFIFTWIWIDLGLGNAFGC